MPAGVFRARNWRNSEYVNPKLSVLRTIEAAISGSNFSLLFPHARESSQSFGFKAVGPAVLADHKGSDGRSLCRPGELNQECTVIPVFQSCGILRRTALNLQRVAIRQDLAATVIIIFVNSDERLQRAVEFARILRSWRRRHQFLQFLVNVENLFLVRFGINAQYLIQKISAHRLGKSGEIEVCEDYDSGVFVGDKHQSRPHTCETPAFFDDLMSGVIITAYTKSVIKTCFVADRWQIGEINFADHAALEYFFNRFWFQDPFVLVRALIQKHQHQLRHICGSRRSRTGRAGYVQV